jgi:hypothetical protein
MLSDIANAVIAIARLLIISVIWSLVLFNIGRIALLAVTLGRYPRQQHLRLHAGRISVAGLLVIALAWSSLAIYNNTFGMPAAEAPTSTALAMPGMCGPPCSTISISR